MYDSIKPAAQITGEEESKNSRREPTSLRVAASIESWGE
jgi:hypothetical protein